MFCYAEQSAKLIMNSSYARNRNGAVVANFKGLYRHSLVGTEGNHESWYSRTRCETVVSLYSDVLCMQWYYTDWCRHKNLVRNMSTPISVLAVLPLENTGSVVSNSTWGNEDRGRTAGGFLVQGILPRM